MYAPRVNTRISSTRNLQNGEGLFDDTRNVLSKRTFYIIVLAISFAFTMVIVLPAATASSRRQRVHQEQGLDTDAVVPSPVPESLSVVSNIDDNSTPDSELVVATDPASPSSPTTPAATPVAASATASATAAESATTPATPATSSQAAPAPGPATAASSVSTPVAQPVAVPAVAPASSPVVDASAATVDSSVEASAPVTEPAAAAASAEEEPMVAPTASPTPAPTDFPPIRINSGGPQKNVNEDGKTWHTDVRAIKGVQVVGESTVYDEPCNVPEHDDLYCSERWFQKDGGYDITVPNGQYKVTLSFVEIFHNGADSRIFNIVIEGQVLRRQYDISKAAEEKKDGIARENFNVEVKDGVLSIEFRKVKQHPKISAVEITKVG